MTIDNRFTKLLGRALPSRFARRFARDEDGALIILSLQILIIMLICTGIAIDFVRQEERRTLIQATIDRAALAAADLGQLLDPKEVVLDYLDKAGLGYLDVDPKVEQGEYDEYRRISIELKDEMPTIFGPLVGVNSLTSNGVAKAEESIGGVEISLVLDISGSMNDPVGTGTRMDKLHDAAGYFVERMFEQVQPPGAPPGRLSISIVPYNQQVQLGTKLASVYKLSTDHTQNTCGDVQTLGFSALSITPSAGLQRTMYGDSFNYSGQDELGQGYWNTPQYTNIKSCAGYSYADIMAWGNDEGKLTTKIKSLQASGDTAIDIGARWGLALLDPSAQPALEALKDATLVDASLLGRPLDYNQAGLPAEQRAMKVMVLMTDGMNTRSYSTKSEYRSGNSPLFSTYTNSYLPSRSYYGGWDSSYRYLYYYAPGRSSPYYRFYDGNWYKSSEIYGTLRRFTWDTIWSKGYTLNWVTSNFMYPAERQLSWVNEEDVFDKYAIQSEFGEKDTNLHSICELAKDDTRKVVIFTVAVDAPPEGSSVLEDCSSGEAYAHDVSSSDLTNAFAQIASAINALRLTN